MPGANASDAGQQRNGSRALPELGLRRAQSPVEPSDPSSELLNWEKQLGSWEESSPSSTADISAERAAELEAHARQLADEVSQQGSEWEPLTASMDDSGEGTDLMAGMGSESSAQSSERASTPSDRRSRSADAEAKSLAPMWPLSLYPLSYRQDYSTENGQRPREGTSAAGLDEASSDALMGGRSGGSAGSQLMDEPKAGSDAEPSEDSESNGEPLRELSNDMLQSWQEERLPSSVSDDYSDDEQGPPSAETGALLPGRRSQLPGVAEKVKRHWMCNVTFIC